MAPLGSRSTSSNQIIGTVGGGRRGGNPNRRPYSQGLTEPDEICEYYLNSSGGEGAGRRSIVGGNGVRRAPVVNNQIVADSSDDESEVLSAESEVLSAESEVSSAESEVSSAESTNNYSNTNSHSQIQSASLRNSRRQSIVSKSNSKQNLKQSVANNSFKRQQPTSRFIQFKNDDADSDVVGRRNRRIRWIAAALLAFFALVALLLFFLWPRKLDIKIRTVEANKRLGDDGYMLLTIDGRIKVNATSDLLTSIDNPNFVPIKIKGAAVIGTWIMTDGSKLKLATSNVTSSITVPRRAQATMPITFSVDFSGDPLTEPIFKDYYRRCVGEGEKYGKVQLEYSVKVAFSYLGVTKQRDLMYNKTYPCQLGPDQVAEILMAAKVDLSKLSGVTGEKLLKRQQQLQQQGREQDKREADRNDNIGRHLQ